MRLVKRQQTLNINVGNAIAVCQQNSPGLSIGEAV